MLVGDLWKFNFEDLTGADMELVHLGREGETNWENGWGEQAERKGGRTHSENRYDKQAGRAGVRMESISSVCWYFAGILILNT